MRLDEILNEAWTKEDYRRNEEWNSRHFNAVGPPNGPWYVEDRFALRDKNVAGPFDNKDEAWAEADRRQKEYSKGEVEYWKKGGKGMTMAPINRGSRYESVKEVQLDEDPFNQSDIDKAINVLAAKIYQSTTSSMWSDKEALDIQLDAVKKQLRSQVLNYMRQGKREQQRLKSQGFDV